MSSQHLNFHLFDVMFSVFCKTVSSVILSKDTYVYTLSVMMAGIGAQWLGSLTHWGHKTVMAQLC